MMQQTLKLRERAASDSAISQWLRFLEPEDVIPASFRPSGLTSYGRPDEGSPARFALAALRVTTRFIPYPALRRAAPSANPRRPTPIIDTEWLRRGNGRERSLWVFLFIAATGGDDLFGVGL